jgi:hypothetical protein
MKDSLLLMEMSCISRVWQHRVRAAGTHVVEPQRHCLRTICRFLRASARSSNSSLVVRGSGYSLLSALAADTTTTAVFRPSDGAGSDASKRRRATGEILTDPPVTVGQLGDSVLVAIRVANCLFESPDEGFTAVEAHLAACATPQKGIPDCLFGSLEKFLAFAISNI